MKVLSTPGMISMMERCCSILAYENLPDGKATVGFEVHVKHVAAAGGSSCTVHARLNEVIEDRKLRFSVEVREGERTIGVGTHERRVVDQAGFGSRLLQSRAMIDRDQVLHVARLARLRLTDEELERMPGELSKILEHVEKMDELDLEGSSRPRTWSSSRTCCARTSRDRVCRARRRSPALPTSPTAASGCPARAARERRPARRSPPPSRRS